MSGHSDISMVMLLIKPAKIILFLSVITGILSCSQEVFVETLTDDITDKGTVVVRTVPEGAKIYINNLFTGYYTPYTVKWLSQEFQNFTIKMDYTQDTVFNFSPVNDSVKNIYVDYYSTATSYGRLICNSSPQKAQIYLDGVGIGKTPMVIPRIFFGIHKIKATYPNCRADSSDIIIRGSTTTSYNVTMYDTTFWIDYRVQNSNIPGNMVNDLVIDKNENLWIALHENGIARFNDGYFTTYNTANSGLPVNYVICMESDNENNLWVGTYKGLAKFDGINWTVYSTDLGNFPDNTILCLYCDNESNMWIGTGNGLVKMKNDQLTLYNAQNSDIEFSTIISITSDKQNNLWIAQSGGVSKFSNGIWTTYNRFRDGLAGTDASSVMIDNDGSVWVSFLENLKQREAGGIMKFDGSKWTNINVPSISKGKIKSMYIDKERNKWICAADGLLKINKDNSTEVFRVPARAIYSNDIRKVLVAPDNSTYIATFGGGLVRWK